MLEQLKAAGAIASASALVVIALFSSSTAVFADNNNGNEGQLQPVWCKITGQGWKAQLSANGNGKDGPLAIDVEDYTKVNGQIVAHDRSDKLDAACAKQNEKDTPQLVTPVAPVSQDPCNPVGSPVGFSNVSWQAAPIAANGYTWSLSADGTTYTATAEEDFMLVNSDNSVSKTINYILPTDTGVMCGMGGGGDTPETPVTPVTPTNPSAPVKPVGLPIAQPVASQAADGLPQTGPVDDMNIAMGTLVMPVLTYGLLLLGREQFGL